MGRCCYLVAQHQQCPQTKMYFKSEFRFASSFRVINSFFMIPGLLLRNSHSVGTPRDSQSHLLGAGTGEFLHKEIVFGVWDEHSGMVLTQIQLREAPDTSSGHGHRNFGDESRISQEWLKPCLWKGAGEQFHDCFLVLFSPIHFLSPTALRYHSSSGPTTLKWWETLRNYQGLPSWKWRFLLGSWGWIHGKLQGKHFFDGPGSPTQNISCTISPMFPFQLTLL